MTIRFTWHPAEWREAHLLATAGQDRRRSGVSMAYMVVGIMVLGGLGDILNTLRLQRQGGLHDRLLPVMVGGAVAGLAIAAWLTWLEQRRRFRDLPTLPEGEQQLTLHELGWAASPAGAAGVSEPAMHGWPELRGQRVGPQVLALLTHDGTTVGVPLRALTEDQGAWIERLLTRKIPRSERQKASPSGSRKGFDSHSSE